MDHDTGASGDQDAAIFRLGDAEPMLTLLLSKEIDCWRMSDVVRTSASTDSNTMEDERASVGFRRSLHTVGPQRRVLRNGAAPHRCRP